MVIIKVLGMLSFILGGVLTFALWNESNYTNFSRDLLFGPLLIYLGIYLMRY